MKRQNLYLLAIVAATAAQCMLTAQEKNSSGTAAAQILAQQRVPPHLVGDLEKATFSNIEHQSIEFLQHTIRPWLVRWEQAISRMLLDESERLLYFARFNVDGLLRGDYKSRMEGYAIGRQNGWLSANDIRQLEDLSDIPEEDGGNLYLMNGNMVTLTQAIKQEGGKDGEGQEGTPNATADGTTNPKRRKR